MSCPPSLSSMRSCRPPDQIEPLDNVRAFVSPEPAERLGGLPDRPAGRRRVAGLDRRRTGLVTFAEGGNVAWVPGHGNKLSNQDIAASWGPSRRSTSPALEAIARDYLPRVQSLLGVNPKELVLDRGRSGQPAEHLWFVDFDVVREGLPIEGARVVFRVNNGNLIQYGTENLPAPGATVPPTRLTQKDALDSVAKLHRRLPARRLVPRRGQPAPAAGRRRQQDGRGLRPSATAAASPRSGSSSSIATA